MHTENVYRSFVGTDIMDNNERSELNKSNWSISEGIILFTDIFIPSLPIHCPSWMPWIIKRIFFRDSCRYIEDISYDSLNNGECFIYINGIMTNESVLNKNRDILRELLNRPINSIYNTTDSILIDLIECVIGKSTDYLTEPVYVTLSCIIKKLLNINITKVVVICHSQGTIIISQVLNGLKRFGFDKELYLKKLEIYAFANCASNMKYILMDKYPYMENFANEDDFVARLGCNCADDVIQYIDIDGPVFINKGKSGHMFNSHYMNNFSEDFPNSRLNNYIK